MSTERRKHSPEVEQANADRLTKRVIIYTVCGIAVMFSMTVCWLSLKGLGIPDPLDRVLTFLLGNITGILTKTGVDNYFKPPEQLPADIGRAVVSASQDEPIQTQETGEIK